MRMSTLFQQGPPVVGRWTLQQAQQQPPTPMLLLPPTLTPLVLLQPLLHRQSPKLLLARTSFHLHLSPFSKRAVPAPATLAALAVPLALSTLLVLLALINTHTTSLHFLRLLWAMSVLELLMSRAVVSAMSEQAADAEVSSTVTHSIVA